jgi:hypothetical protein
MRIPAKVYFCVHGAQDLTVQNVNLIYAIYSCKLTFSYRPYYIYIYVYTHTQQCPHIRR